MEHGDVFFVVCPYILLVVAPKIGMNRTEIILSSSGCNSSRFSGPCTRSYVKGIPQKRHLHVPHMHHFSVKGHTKKDISMFHAKKDIPMFSKGFLSPITLKLSAGVICYNLQVRFTADILRTQWHTMGKSGPSVGYSRL
jgi:hypothetical protein